MEADGWINASIHTTCVKELLKITIKWATVTVKNKQTSVTSLFDRYYVCDMPTPLRSQTTRDDSFSKNRALMLKSYRSDRKRRKKKITVTLQKHLRFAQMSQTFMLRSKIIRMPP